MFKQYFVLYNSYTTYNISYNILNIFKIYSTILKYVIRSIELE